MQCDFRRLAIVSRGEAAMCFIHAAREFDQEYGTSLCTITLFTEPDRREMSVREADEEFAASILVRTCHRVRRARAEAASAFGDPMLFMEQMITGARHFEAQISPTITLQDGRYQIHSVSVGGFLPTSYLIRNGKRPWGHPRDRLAAGQRAGDCPETRKDMGTSQTAQNLRIGHFDEKGGWLGSGFARWADIRVG